MFLRRDCNKGFAEVTGNCVNRGARYGMEVPCICRLYGPTIYIQRLQQNYHTVATRERTFVIQAREFFTISGPKITLRFRTYHVRINDVT